jgi:hypothetical protein
VTEKDYINIYKVDTIKEIVSFLHNPVPFCRYCNLNDSTYGIEWEVSKKEISEWA